MLSSFPKFSTFTKTLTSCFQIADVLELSAEIAKFSGENLSYFTTQEERDTMEAIDQEFVQGEADVFRDNNYDMDDLFVGMNNEHPVYTWVPLIPIYGLRVTKSHTHIWA